MDDLLTNRSAYHAKRGDFAGFRLSLPLELDEEAVYLFFKDFRNNLSDVDEEQENWLTLKEFQEFQEFQDQDSTQNIILQLNEVADLASRMRMRRAAKRTSIRRSRKRFMRRKVRKNRNQLKKRAYGQVKNMLRKRMSGGRSWSKLPLATRVRIDKAIDKRKNVLSRMVKARIPKMATQETKRLQRVRLNSSYDYGNLSLLIENKPGSHSAKASEAKSPEAKKHTQEVDKERQQRHREKVDTVLSEFIKTVVIGKRNGKFSLLRKGSTASGKHTDIKEVSSIGQATGICQTQVREGNFRQTPTSKKLCGIISLANKRKERKEKQGNTEMESESSQSGQQSLVQPEIPYGDQPADLNKLQAALKNIAVREHTSKMMENGFELAQKVDKTNSDGIEELVQTLQGFLNKNKKDLTNDEVEEMNDLYDDIFEVFGNAKDTQTVITNGNLLRSGIEQYTNLMYEEDASTGEMVSRRLFNTGNSTFDRAENYQIVNVGSGIVGVIRDGAIRSGKTDLVFVNMPMLAGFLGKNIDNLSENEKQKLAQNHADMINIATGGASKKKKSSEGAAIKYVEEFQKWKDSHSDDEAAQLREYDSTVESPNYRKLQRLANTGMIGVSMKQGDFRFASGNLEDGDGLASITIAHEAVKKRFENSANSDSGVAKKFAEFSKSIDEIIGEIATSGSLRQRTEIGTSEYAKYSDTIVADNVARLEAIKVKVTSMFSDIFSPKNLRDNEFNREYLKEMFRYIVTGEGRIHPNSPVGIPDYILATESKDSGGVRFVSIDDSLYDTLNSSVIAGDIEISASSKSESHKSKADRANKAEWAKHFTKIRDMLRSGKSIGGLTSKDADDANKIQDILIRNANEGYRDLKVMGIDALREKWKEEGVDTNDPTSSAYLVEKGLRTPGYTMRLVHSVVVENDVTSKVPGAIVASYQFNKLLGFLVERYSSKKHLLGEENTAEENETQKKISDYLELAKVSIETSPDVLESLLNFFEIGFDVFTNDINLYDLLPNQNIKGNTNSVYINKKEIKIPIEECDCGTSDYYKSIGSNFLAEAKKRNYKKEYNDFHGKPEERKKRSRRVLARRILAKLGRVHKGDGKDVDHKDGNAMNNSPKNLHAIDASTNRAKH